MYTYKDGVFRHRGRHITLKKSISIPAYRRFTKTATQKKRPGGFQRQIEFNWTERSLTSAFRFTMWLDLTNSGTQKKQPAMWHFVRFLVTELHSKEGETPKRGLWAVRSTGPPSSPGRLVPRSMTGGGPVDTAVTSQWPLLGSFFPRPWISKDPHWGRYLNRL